MIQQLLKISQTTPLKTYSSTKEWSEDYFQFLKDESPINKAIQGGFMSQQFSFAFMAGYQAALEKMFPTIAPNELKALCVSEANGAHPKAIETKLIDNKLTGEKTYVTAGSEAEHLLILCKTTETINDKPILKMVYLNNEVEGTEITDFDLPFMLEVKHGKIRLDNVEVKEDQILNGDGYSDYTKPFRTLEDIHVGAAYQAMLLRQAIENKWDEDLRDNILFNLYALKSLSQHPPLDAETLLLLNSTEKNFEALLPAIDLNIATHCKERFKSDWTLNKRVLSMAKKVKELRLLKSRKALFT